nr:oligosaccharide flippase family protein [uncultured Rhodoferax sp.]
MSGKNELLGKAVRAAGWGYAGTAVKLVMQLGVQILLARLLGPAEYGIFAIGVIVVAFALYFGDVASSALIPRPEPSADELRFAFTWQLIVSVLVTAVIYGIAEPVAQFVNEPRAVGVLQTLAFVCALNAFGGVSLAILRRRLDYKRIQIAQVSGYFVGYVLIALPWAVWGTPSVAALVAAWLVQVGVTSLLFYIFAPHPVTPKLKCNGGADLLLFGWHSLVSNLSTWALTNVDRVIVARHFPVSQVGLYTTASNLLSTPLSQIYATFQSVIFSASSQLDKDKTNTLFSNLVFMAVLVVGFIYGTTYSSATMIVDFLYGKQWMGTVPFIQIFSIALFFNAISGIVTPLLWAHGEIKRDSKVQVLLAIGLAILAVFASQHSIIYVCTAVALIAALRAIFLLAIGLNKFLIPQNGFFMELVRLISAQILIIALVTLIANELSKLNIPSLAGLALTSILTSIFYLILIKKAGGIGKGFKTSILIFRFLPPWLLPQLD